MDELLKQAVQAVKEDGMTFRAAAKKFKVPRTTLVRRVKIPETKCVGRPRFFSQEDEELLHQMLKNCQVFQQPLSKEKFCELAEKLAVQKGYEAHTFGKDFLVKFVKRYPDLKLRKKGSWKKEEKTWNAEKCEKYIEILKNLIDQSYLVDPRSIFCLESLERQAAPVDPTKKGTSKAKTPTRPKTKKKKVPTSSEANEPGYSVMVCASADGQTQVPLVLRDRKLFVEPWFSETNQEVVIGENQTGMFGTDDLAVFLKCQLIPHIRSFDPPLEKSVLFLDSRWNHAYNLEIVEDCLKNKIQIVGFPPLHSDKLHPFNKSELRKMARIWFDFISERDHPINEFVRHNMLARSIAVSEHKGNLKRLMQAGYKKAGIYPFDPATIRATVSVAVPKKSSAVKSGFLQTISTADPATRCCDLDRFFLAVDECSVQLGMQYGLPQEPISQAMTQFKDSLRLAHDSG